MDGLFLGRISPGRLFPGEPLSVDFSRVDFSWETLPGETLLWETFSGGDSPWVDFSWVDLAQGVRPNLTLGFMLTFGSAPGGRLAAVCPAAVVRDSNALNVSDNL